MKEYVVETDVLVIGAGFAGFFAAIKAKEKGVDVTLVDKCYAGKSGSSAYPDTWLTFNPEWGHKLEAWMDQFNKSGEYLNNREWTEIVLKGSYSSFKDLVSYGVKFFKDDGEYRRSKGSPEAVFEQLLFGGSYEAGGRRETAQVLRRHAVKSGIKIMDRIMITDLIKQGGRVVGAVGIPMESYDVYIFKAKATVISTGAAGFKPAGWPISELTGDGMAIAYRVGAELVGSEFVDTHSIWADFPASRKMSRITSPGQNGPTPIYPPIRTRSKTFNAEGDYIPSGPPSNAVRFSTEAHAGRAPIFAQVPSAAATYYGVADRVFAEGGWIRQTGCAVGGMATHTTEGLWPINTKCESSVPGLYAAGDSLGTYMVGAIYVTSGIATAGAVVTGTRAGQHAAEYALQAEKQTVDGEELTNLKKRVHAPLERKCGFGPRWLTQVLQNITRPYYILYVKHEMRLQAALTLVEFIRDHLVPKLYAMDPHELRLVHETKNMVLNAEMKLRCSLFRTESRGRHYREDYPRRDDSAWLAWIKLSEKNGTMKLSKEPIPKKWHPDPSKPYEERYPARFPGE